MHTLDQTDQRCDVWSIRARGAAEVQFQLLLVQNGKATVAATGGCRWDKEQWLPEWPQHTSLVLAASVVKGGILFSLSMDTGQMGPEYMSGHSFRAPTVRGNLRGRRAVSAHTARPGTLYVLSVCEVSPWQEGLGETNNISDREIAMLDVVRQSKERPAHTFVVLTARWEDHFSGM